VRIRHRNLPYAEMGRDGGEVFPEGERQDVPAVVEGRHLRSRDAPGSQQRREKHDDGEDVEKRDRDRIREAVEDDFIDHVSARADGVPAQTQHRDPHSLPHGRALLHRGHLSAKPRRDVVYSGGIAGGGVT